LFFINKKVINKIIILLLNFIKIYEEKK
jgi:hypothetical protein